MRHFSLLSAILLASAHSAYAQRFTRPTAGEAALVPHVIAAIALVPGADMVFRGSLGGMSPSFPLYRLQGLDSIHPSGSASHLGSVTDPHLELIREISRRGVSAEEFRFMPPELKISTLRAAAETVAGEAKYRLSKVKESVRALQATESLEMPDADQAAEDALALRETHWTYLRQWEQVELESAIRQIDSVRKARRVAKQLEAWGSPVFYVNGVWGLRGEDSITTSLPEVVGTQIAALGNNRANNWDVPSVAVAAAAFKGTLESGPLSPSVIEAYRAGGRPSLADHLNALLRISSRDPKQRGLVDNAVSALRAGNPSLRNLNELLTYYSYLLENDRNKPLWFRQYLRYHVVKGVGSQHPAGRSGPAEWAKVEKKIAEAVIRLNHAAKIWRWVSIALLVPSLIATAMSGINTAGIFFLLIFLGGVALMISGVYGFRRSALVKLFRSIEHHITGEYRDPK